MQRRLKSLFRRNGFLPVAYDFCERIVWIKGQFFVLAAQTREDILCKFYILFAKVLLQKS